MSARLIALARAQAAGLRSALSACNESQPALRARLATAADTLEGLALLAEHAHHRAIEIAERLTTCATDLRDGAAGGAL